MSEPSGPMEKGTMYIVRPRMQPLKVSRRIVFISLGSIQLLVGPASSSLIEQIKVRSSTRATSLGFERAKNEFGRFCELSGVKVPLATNSWVKRFHSASEPSHHWMRSGVVSCATSCTHDNSLLFFVGASAKPGMVALLMSTP